MRTQQRLIPKTRVCGDASQQSALHYWEIWTSSTQRAKQLPYKTAPFPWVANEPRLHLVLSAWGCANLTKFQDPISNVYCKTTTLPSTLRRQHSNTSRNHDFWCRKLFHFQPQNSTTGFAVSTFTKEVGCTPKRANPRISLQICYFAVTTRKDRLRNENVPSLLYGWQATRSQKHQHTALWEPGKERGIH